MFRKVLLLFIGIFLFVFLFSSPIKYASANAPQRIFGVDRYETAVKISQAGWNNAETIVLARGDAFPDALAGTPLAYRLDAPILLTRPTSLDDTTKNEITRLGAKEVIILGGYGAISEEVELELVGMGLIVRRIGGTDRYDTAKLIAEELGSTNRAIVTFGGNFPDALAIAPYAAQNGIPILLTRTDSLPSNTQEALLGIEETIVVGGTSVISDLVMSQLPKAKRIGGVDRYDTTAKIIKELDMSTDAVYIATGINFADALTGSVLASKNASPVLLVHTNHVPSHIKELIFDRDIRNFTILGGETAVSALTVDELFKDPDPLKGKVTIENPIDVFTLFAFMNHTGYNHDNNYVNGEFVYHPVRAGVRNDLKEINPTLTVPYYYAGVDAVHTMVEGDFASLTGYMGEPPIFQFDSSIEDVFGLYMYPFTGLDSLLTEFYREAEIERLYNKYKPDYDEHIAEFEREAIPILVDIIDYFNLNLDETYGIRFIPNLLLTYWRGYMIDPNGRWGEKQPVVIMYGPDPRGINLINIAHEFAHVFTTPICNSNDLTSRQLGAALYLKYGDPTGGYGSYIKNIDESFVRAISGWATNRPQSYFSNEDAAGFFMTTFVYERIEKFDKSQRFEDWVRAIMLEYIEYISD